LQRALDAGSVEQAEGGVQDLSEASVGVVEHRSGVDDDTDPQLAFWRAASGQDTTDSCGKIIRKPVHFRVSVTR
jgi:hypothetical protein